MVKRTKARSIGFALLLAAFLSAGVFAAVQIVFTQLNYAGARREYDMLRQYAPAPDAPMPQPSPEPTALSGQSPSDPVPDTDLSAINPDYIGWLCIEGADIDYPVVRGADNERYLSTSFTGEENASGAIFMDAGCTEGFNAPFAILYGHNMNDGSMFSNLNRYTDAGYLSGHDTVSVVTVAGDVLSYRIISAYVTDVHDAAYALIGKNPEAVREYIASIEATQGIAGILALSTCTNSGDDNERLLALAVPS